ncbi:hypothetical protein IQ268_10355 [Oculatella sp. LEGE 06141]|uniref:hypothetical protein n=1 Tax=Oculatella sp. LEGE 06141 TaxID=1828648 RepID=UPI001882BB26|nr:hypothetical protein [Oculatella sp. LEGE 06141]MBE9178963.1 hypothetical protein [Oculatella sp. LEGE 06141]
MSLFVNSAQELTYQHISEYLRSSSLFKDTMQAATDAPTFNLLYQPSTLIEVEVLPWEIHPWQDAELAVVKASSHITIGRTMDAEVIQFLLAENSKMRFGAFQLDEAGQVLFVHSILGGENMDLLELESCILSVAAIAATYEDILAAKFNGQRLVERPLVEI